MRFRYAVLFVPLLATAIGAAPVEPEVGIVFPPAPAPQPAPPGAAAKLTKGLIYDIRCTKECVVRAYPSALVSIEKEIIPAGETLRYKADFTDGAQTHVYKGPMTVYLVKAVGTGPVELVVTPLGLKAEKEIETRTVDVDAGQGPQPPPTPPTPPNPPTPVPVTSFRVILVYESGDTLTAAQTGVLYGKTVEDYLNLKCTKDGADPGWRRRDKDAATTGDTATMNALWGTVKPAVTSTPAFAIEVNRKVTIEPLPATTADALTLLKKYAEGK